MEVSYTMQFRDWIAAYRIGFTHFRGLNAFRVVALVLAAAVFLVVLALSWLDARSHYHGAVPLSYTLSMLRSLAIAPIVGAIVMPFLLWLLSARTLLLDNQSVIIRSKSGKAYMYWRTVSAIFKDADYIAVCGSGFDALVIPVSAFQDQQDAVAFFANAHYLWQRSNNLLLPPVSETGIWPPAPCVTDAQEPEKRL